LTRVGFSHDSWSACASATDVGKCLQVVGLTVRRIIMHITAGHSFDAA
jgi:hypothetical protein